MHLPLLPLAALLVGSAAYYDTVLEKKCMALKRSNENAAYVNGICFVAVRDVKKIKYSEWPKLQENCKLINGYKGYLAHVPDRGFLAKMFKAELFAKKSKYFIGARQFPEMACEESGGVCDRETTHRENWNYFDEKNQIVSPVNMSVFMDGQPDNTNPAENVAIIDSFDSYDGGLNDINPDKEGAQPLCQFIDYLKCDDGYILIRDRCYKIHKEPANAADAKKKCTSDQGVLASIHDDAMNAIIIDYSRDDNKNMVNQPIRFGLAYGDSWINDDGTPVDYFRWWDQAGCGIPTAFTGGNVRAALVVSGKARNPDPSYWLVVKDTDPLPFLCQKQPSKAYDSA